MRKISVRLHYNLGLFFFILTLFLISFPRSWSLYPLGAFLFVGLILWIKDFKTNWDTLILNWYLIFPPILFFLVQVVNSIINASPIILLVDRLMFILVPLLGFSLFSKDYFKSSLRKIFLSFIYGILLITLFLVLRLLYIIFLQDHDASIIDYLKANSYSFLSIGFSVVEHPTYLSMKIIWILILVFLIPEDLRIPQSVRIIIVLLLSLSIFLLSSKAGMIAWMILSSLFIIFILKNKGASHILKFITIVIFVILILTIIKRNIVVNLYLRDVKSNLNTEKIDLKNIDRRTREWYTAFNLIKERPLNGFGVDKIQQKMIDSYNKYGFVVEAEMKYNAHNQLLETQATFGILGTLSLLWMLLTPFIYRNRLKDSKLATAFVLLMSYFLFFESMFNRQWGIMFFVLFYCILVTHTKVNNHSVYQNRND